MECIAELVCLGVACHPASVYECDGSSIVQPYDTAAVDGVTGEGYIVEVQYSVGIADYAIVLAGAIPDGAVSQCQFRFPGEAVCNAYSTCIAISIRESDTVESHIRLVAEVEQLYASAAADNGFIGLGVTAGEVGAGAVCGISSLDGNLHKFGVSAVFYEKPLVKGVCTSCHIYGGAIEDFRIDIGYLLFPVPGQQVDKAFRIHGIVPVCPRAVSCRGRLDIIGVRIDLYRSFRNYQCAPVSVCRVCK